MHYRRLYLQPDGEQFESQLLNFMVSLGILNTNEASAKYSYRLYEKHIDSHIL